MFDNFFLDGNYVEQQNEVGKILLVYGKSSIFKKEYGEKRMRFIKNLRINQRAIGYDIDESSSPPECDDLKSNDYHIILLALKSKAMLLLTDDKLLTKDYKSKIRGSVITSRTKEVHIKDLVRRNSSPICKRCDV